MYVSLYTLGRTWFEALRIDKATQVFGIRFNLLLSAAICVGAVAWFIALGRRKDAASDTQDDARRVSVEG
jgi:prolipoprotein diacylglyceryltransferase